MDDEIGAALREPLTTDDHLTAQPTAHSNAQPTAQHAAQSSAQLGTEPGDQFSDSRETTGAPGHEYGNRMADLARDLRSQKSSVSTLQHVVRATSEMVKNCADVAITLTRSDGSVETQVTLGSGIAERAGELQAEYAEGPCVDATWNSPLVRANNLPDDGTWPRWGVAAADELGIRSVLCVHLYTHENHDLGALQLYSTMVGAFDDAAVDEVLGIAAQAAVALGAVENFESMQFGLVRRTIIGQATGIMMERYRLDAHQAFEVLRRTSSETGRKVYDLALDMVNGQRPEGL